VPGDFFLPDGGGFREKDRCHGHIDWLGYDGLR
jgi:hypothetical protein